VVCGFSPCLAVLRNVWVTSGQDAAFSSDASKIIFTSGNSLFEVGADGARLRKLLTASGFSGFPRLVPGRKAGTLPANARYSHNGVLWEAYGGREQPSSLVLGDGWAVLRAHGVLMVSTLCTTHGAKPRKDSGPCGKTAAGCAEAIASQCC